MKRARKTEVTPAAGRRQSPAGDYVVVSTSGETVRAFVPHPLPPDPPPELTPADRELLERATHALGRLDGVAAALPDASLFIYFHVRKEALLSSQIEGTQSSFADLLLYESEFAPGAPLADVEEVSRYVAAMGHGLRRLRTDGFPLSLRLLREIHGVLLAKGRGSEKTPGEFRRSQNWVGGARPGVALFVPPPPDRVVECMGALELFLHDRPVRTQPLLKAALAHVQFETIHPFLDGNGRIGRLLITLILCAEGVLREPLLYLSLYFKRNRQEYYERLQRVRTDGEWLEWLRFFLVGVEETARQAADTIRRLIERVEADRRRIAALGRPGGSAAELHGLLQRKPVVSVPGAARDLGLSAPTVRAAAKRLERLGLLKEITGKRRDRLYLYAPYVKILEEGTAPL